MERHQFAVLLALLICNSSGFCPKGFGSDSFFPPEWAIPKWPQDMPIEAASHLRTVTLDGFVEESLNDEYLEGPTPEFRVQGRETYWQSSGQHFIFYCKKYDKWRIADLSGFGANKGDSVAHPGLLPECLALASVAAPGLDILNASLVKGWMEVEYDEWEYREDAGVVDVGKLSDQLELEEATSEVSADCEDDADDGSGGIGSRKKSSCPVMPIVRDAKEKVIQATRAASKWVRRLFPKLLGEPSEEDAIPEADKEQNVLFEQTIEIGDTVVLTSDEDLMRRSFSSSGYQWNDDMIGMLGQTRKVANVKVNGNIVAVEEDEENHNKRFWYYSRKAIVQIIKPDADSGTCDPVTQDGCNFKEKFYIERQAKATVEDHKAELQRLVKQKDVVMKPDQKSWLMARINILEKMIAFVSDDGRMEEEVAL